MLSEGIKTGLKELAKIKATPDQRVNALVPWFAEQIAALRFKNPDAIACREDLDLAKKLVEPLRATLIAGFAARGAP